MPLEIINICKTFSGVSVLSDVSLSAAAAEVHAVTGENGAGKSTLMNIVAGIHAPDSGEVRAGRQRILPGSPNAARRAGIATIHQELLPFLDLSVAENIFMGQESVAGPLGWLKKSEMREQACVLLRRLGTDLDPRTKMRALPLAEMQIVEIAKALAARAQVIIMDEPTSALSVHETGALFKIIADLKRAGTSVLYISHKLDEVFRLADRVSVLRDGRLVATRPIADLTQDDLISLMVGRQMERASPRPPASKGAVAFSVQSLQKHKRFSGVSFEVRHGEVLGLAGLMGAGRSDILNALYGLQPPDGGQISVRRARVHIRSTRDALAAGIGLVSEDRKRFGFIPTFRVKRNLTLAALRRWCRGGFIQHGSEARAAADQISRLKVKTAGNDPFIERLSGGNQQKVVLARTLMTEPDVVLLDEPTRGIDIAAKAEVHALIKELARGGKAVVLVSSELPELFALSDRILVIRQGQVAAELQTTSTTPEEVMKFAISK